VSLPSVTLSGRLRKNRLDNRSDCSLRIPAACLFPLKAHQTAFCGNTQMGKTEGAVEKHFDLKAVRLPRMVLGYILEGHHHFIGQLFP